MCFFTNKFLVILVFFSFILFCFFAFFFPHQRSLRESFSSLQYLFREMLNVHYWEQRVQSEALEWKDKPTRGCSRCGGCSVRRRAGPARRAPLSWLSKALEPELLNHVLVHGRGDGAAERWIRRAHRSPVSVSWRRRLLASRCKPLVIITPLLPVPASGRRSWELVLVLLNPAKGGQPVNLCADTLNLKDT